MKSDKHAFPSHISEGLTARDYIAIQAMTGLLATTSVSEPNRHALPSKVAALAYSYADAMIKQSEVKDVN